MARDSGGGGSGGISRNTRPESARNISRFDYGQYYRGSRAQDGDA